MKRTEQYLNKLILENVFKRVNRELERIPRHPIRLMISISGEYRIFVYMDDIPGSDYIVSVVRSKCLILKIQLNSDSAFWSPLGIKEKRLLLKILTK